MIFRFSSRTRMLIWFTIQKENIKLIFYHNALKQAVYDRFMTGGFWNVWDDNDKNLENWTQMKVYVLYAKVTVWKMKYIFYLNVKHIIVREILFQGKYVCRMHLLHMFTCLCMYVCLYICVCMYVFMYACVCIYIYVYHFMSY